jgi:bifunctional DNase/RNase
MSNTKMVEVIIDSVRVSLTNQQRIVVLRDINAERYLPIWIGPYEAESITIALQEIEVSRPQTRFNKEHFQSNECPFAQGRSAFLKR